MPYKDKKRDKEYHREYIERWNKENPTKLLAYQQKYHQTPQGKEIQRLASKRWRAANPEKSRASVRQYQNEHPEWFLQQQAKHRAYNASIKAEVLTHYGLDKYACVQCGESRTACLSIDHVNGNGEGRKHRKEIGSGTKLYLWLKRNKYPQGFQTLCMNCQFIKRAAERECLGPLKYRI